MKKFNLVYQNVKINKSPLTEKEADYQIGIIIMNYGYKPAKVEI